MDAEHYIQRSRQLRRAGRERECLDLLREGVERFPEHPVLLMDYAGRLLVVDEGEAAEQALQALVVGGTGDELLCVRAAGILLAVGRLDAAEPLVRHMIETFGDDAAYPGELLELTGRVLFAKGDFEGAEEAFVGALEIEPSNIWFLTHLVRCVARRAGPAEARVVLERYRPGVGDTPELDDLLAELEA